MLDSLINLVKENAQGIVVDNTNVPNENNDDVINETGNSIVDGLKNAVSGGNLDSVMALFNQKGGGNILENPIVQSIISGLTENLKSKFNLEGGEASTVANKLVPEVMGKMAAKTNEPVDNGFDLQDILSNVGAGNLGDIGDLIGKFTSGSGDGKEEGGIGGMIKGLF